jgi:multidrug efflux pump subunit AcrB
VVFEVSVEVRQPVLLSSLIIGVVFAPMGLTYVFMIVASSFVALTLTPALCAILLANTRLPAENPWIAS